jgi:hypothetical protein
MKALFGFSGTRRFLVHSMFVAGVCGGVASAAQSGLSPSSARPPVQITVTDPGPIGVNTTTALFSQVAIGGGFQTVFTLLNTGASDLSGVLILTQGNGTAMTATFTAPPAAPATGSSYEIGPIRSGGTQFITASPVSPANPTVAGWGRVESSGGTLGGVGTFTVTQGGRLTTVAGVLSGGLMNVATVPVDNNEAQNRFTGYAIANPSNAAINVKIVVVRTDGTPVQTLNLPALNPLGPQRQVARFLFQDAPSLLTFQGSMVFIGQGGSEFSLVALVQDQSLITAIPVIPSKAPGIN